MSYSNPEVEAFHKAVFRGKKNEVKALLNDKVIVGTRSDGISALHIVASTGSTRICKVICMFSSQFFFFFSSCFSAQLLLPGMNGSLELRESHGATALNIACQNGHSGVCKLLLEAGADVNAGRADHVTPLYIAAQEGHSKIVQVGWLVGWLLLEFFFSSSFRCCCNFGWMLPISVLLVRQLCLLLLKRDVPRWWKCSSLPALQ